MKSPCTISNGYDHRKVPHLRRIAAPKDVIWFRALRSLQSEPSRHSGRIRAAVGATHTSQAIRDALIVHGAVVVQFDSSARVHPLKRKCRILFTRSAPDTIAWTRKECFRWDCKLHGPGNASGSQRRQNSKFRTASALKTHQIVGSVCSARPILRDDNVERDEKGG